MAASSFLTTPEQRPTTRPPTNRATSGATTPQMPLKMPDDLSVLGSIGSSTDRPKAKPSAYSIAQTASAMTPPAKTEPQLTLGRAVGSTTSVPPNGTSRVVTVSMKTSSRQTHVDQPCSAELLEVLHTAFQGCASDTGTSRAGPRCGRSASRPA